MYTLRIKSFNFNDKIYGSNDLLAKLSFPILSLEFFTYITVTSTDLNITSIKSSVN